jgi:hypothetical protein
MDFAFFPLPHSHFQILFSAFRIPTSEFFYMLYALLTRNPHNPKPETCNSKPATRNPQPATRNPQPVTRNPQLATRNSQPETRNPQPATRNS